MRGEVLLLGAVALVLTSCADFMAVRTITPKKRNSERFSDDEGGIGGMSGGGQARVSKESEDVAVGKAPVNVGYLPVEVGENVVVNGNLLPSDDRIVWAPEDLNEEVKLGDEFNKKAKLKSVWHQSFQEARRESMRSGKPLLIWFTKTGSPGSPICLRLQREVFGTADFGAWAKEKLVRLKVDSSGGTRETDENGNLSASMTERRKYAESLKKQFRVLGHPTLIVLQPDGGVYTRESGFSRGGKSELWGKLKNAALTIEHNRGVWERKMALKGYRRWTGSNEEVVFAKLRRYHDGTLWLIEPDGSTIKTSEKTLSQSDRDWLAAEKKKRGL